MKRIILLILIIFCYQSISAQTDSSKKVFVLKSTAARSVKTIPLTKAVTIRKDALKLKLQLTQFSDSIGITKKDMDATIDKMKDDLDSMSEMGETESLRLQMAVDRLSKMMSTLSNMLKKIGDTSQSITQNLK